MSASTKKFYSHPADKPKSSLIEHLLTVAERSERLFSKTKFSNKKIAFYSGLLHDIGKINPWYQEVFAKNADEKIKDEMSKIYEQVHSSLSAWAAESLLTKKLGIGKKEKIQILLLIYGHHSTVRNRLGDIKETDNFKNSKKDMIPLLIEFSKQVSKIPEFDGLDWENCGNNFCDPVDFQINLSEYACGIDQYAEMLCAFSCLLQADRGSFGDEFVPKFDIDFDTKSQIRKSVLSQIRTEFQNQVAKNFDESEPISIIQAPTGIGKTKVFLDIISRYKNHKDIHKVFYFSPLLALTDDFEKKIEQVVPNKNQLEEILSYDHIFAGSIIDKRKYESGTGQESNWSFEIESFSKKFVIATTQRLLMTLFSNKTRDNLKLDSFSNSVLIVDEVQTIPKFFLPTFKEYLYTLNHFLGTKIILVSATIPHELKDVPLVTLEKSTLDSYLQMTKKSLTYNKSLELDSIQIKKTLIMSNTREKAANILLEARKSINTKLLYMSTGIRKIDRKKIIEYILKPDSEFLLVSTQVVEAGIDVSFSNVYREMCPLDNIIQVMGRLNREGNDKNASLVVFESDGRSIPYSELEVNESREIIKRTDNSINLYDSLAKYYEIVSEKNKTNEKKSKEISEYIDKLDFEETWSFVKNNVLGDDERDTAFIPNPEDWDDFKESLMNHDKKKSFKKYGLYLASIPKAKNLDYGQMFDSELLEKEILLPKKEKLAEIYDKDLGLDIWLIK